MSECERKGRLVRGCRWEPRYDVSEPVYPSRVGFTLTGLEQDTLVRRETYVRDVCVTCGRTVERQDQSAGAAA